MDTVVVSPSFQIRIPKCIRQALTLKPGQRLRIVQYGQRIELVPLRPLFECPQLLAAAGPQEGGGARDAVPASKPAAG